MRTVARITKQQQRRLKVFLIVEGRLLIHIPLLLAAAVLGGIPLNSHASFCQNNRLSMGGFDPQLGSVTLCEIGRAHV